MRVGDKFHSNINGGTKVTVIDITFCREVGNKCKYVILGVADGLLLKFEVYSSYNLEGEISFGTPKFVDCIDILENLKRL